MDNKPSSPVYKAPDWAERLQAARLVAMQFLRRYADWLASQSWKRLVLLGALALAGTGILSSMPPFSTEWGGGTRLVEPDRHAAAKAKAKAKARAAKTPGVVVTVDDDGVHINGHVSADPAASAASGAPATPATPEVPDVNIKLPPGANTEEVRRAIEEAKDEIRSAIEAANEAAAEAAAAEAAGRPRYEHVPGFVLGEVLVPLMLIIIVASIIAKVMGTGRKKAEAVAAVATERAESESLKRQVVEARMAAMQAQVEPHFLFNTLASIDHLIETDPARASQMQKNLIALLRASMPTMRETHASGMRELAREMAVIKPYLEILKVRMEERLQVELDVPEGLQSAEFPPMMIQSLVENAIKHGLEPKAEGGKLSVRAEIRHGKLCITVADTGLGFGKAATAGTGVGLANIRERLQLLYGTKATLTVTENQPSGTVVTITVPYTHRNQEGA
ncbi:sensor histidine kinase [Ideonella sp. BN130291]|uniref:sensor histidine kinase n=1 Tax=Ideonella sp. BN130291 TaxID=3112940 RepID=UPI002E26D8E5|nr:sensor histidine kinase [Ideonella sp. BN130291]